MKTHSSRSHRSDRTRLPIIAGSVIAREGGGKSHFLLTLPKPTAILSVDPNTSYVIDQALEDGEIEEGDVRLLYVPMPAVAFNEREDIKEESKEQWDAIMEFLTPMVEQERERPKSLGLDTGTELYVLRQLMTFGKTDQIVPEVRRNMMGPVNRAYSGIIETFKNKGVHVVVTHRSKEVWADKTIRRGSAVEDTRVRLDGPFDQERDGFKHTGNITSVEVVLAHDPSRHEKLRAQFGMKVVRCGHRPTLVGKEFWGTEKLEDGSRIARPSFAFLAQQMFPRTRIEDWS